MSDLHIHYNDYGKALCGAPTSEQNLGGIISCPDCLEAVTHRYTDHRQETDQ